MAMAVATGMRMGYTHAVDVYYGMNCSVMLALRAGRMTPSRICLNSTNNNGHCRSFVFYVRMLLGWCVVRVIIFSAHNLD